MRLRALVLNIEVRVQIMAFLGEMTTVFLEELHYISQFTTVPVQAFSFKEILEARSVEDAVTVVLLGIL